MLQRRRRKKDKVSYSQKNIEHYIYSSTHPSSTFINNLLHSKSTYFYKWWGEKNSTLSSKWGVSNRLAYSCLVPSFCMLSLLVGLYFVINPMVGSAGNSVHAWDWSSAGDNSNTNDDIIKFSINSESSGSINAKVGETAYSNHTVSINLANAKGYALGISYTNDSTGLVNKDTVSTSGAENSVISGANNTTGTNMADNTWGYSWSSNINADSTTMVYKTVPSKNSIATLAESTNLTNNKLDMTGKLAFAVKFGEKAVAGHYTANVLLSLAVQPAEITAAWDNITYLQEMTPEICSEAAANASRTLIDKRDNKTYSVAKLKDNECWITQNLELALTNITLTPDDTDITSNWTPNLTDGKVSLVDGLYLGYVNTQAGHLLQKDSTYYSWSAAAAKGDKNLSSGQATPTSICPKGWTIPSTAQYNTMKDGLTTSQLGAAPYNFFNTGIGSVSNSNIYGASCGCQRYYAWTNDGGEISFEVYARACDPCISEIAAAYVMRCVAR